MMSPEWEAWYAAGNSINGTYPAFEKLVAIHIGEAERLLELGVGFGSNIPGLVRRFGQYHGIDGSHSAVNLLHEKFPDLRQHIKCADFCSEIPFEYGFDAIVDRASIAHNDLASIRSCLDLAWQALKPGGLLICADWFSASHSEACRGDELERGTRTGYEDGQFKDVGKVHFSTQEELEDLFERFEGIHMEERIARRPGPNSLVQAPMRFYFISRKFYWSEYVRATWEIVARKPT